MPSRGATLALASLLAIGLIGCTPDPGSVLTPPAAVELPPLSVSNETSIPISLIVNGEVIEIVSPGDREDPIEAALPSLPWSIEARSPTGRVLVTLAVGPEDRITATHGRATGVDLSCGRLRIWSGPPLDGPTFIPGPSGDCE
ncbi:MAG: hypothetical protein A2V85_14205 [Chloroflexi bacterium RBG_16_72_14]|nr:MAG: hypothetical protein A2V85_14205 [Chloroflexi bacterium RBG_16_72_14]